MPSTMSRVRREAAPGSRGASGFGFQVSGFGFRVLGLGFKIQSAGFGFQVSGSRLRVQGAGFGLQVQDSESRVEVPMPSTMSRVRRNGSSSGIERSLP